MNLFETRDLAACAACFVDARLIGGGVVGGGGGVLSLEFTRFDQVPQLEFLNKFALARHECEIDGGEGAVSVLAASGRVRLTPAEAFLISL